MNHRVAVPFNRRKGPPGYHSPSAWPDQGQVLSMVTHVPSRFLHAAETGIVHHLNGPESLAALLTCLTNLNFSTINELPFLYRRPERGRCPASCQDILILHWNHLKLPRL